MSKHDYTVLPLFGKGDVLELAIAASNKLREANWLNTIHA
ncbi:MAG: hypothetical protein RLZ92_78 [Pseudomonadota bacterium]|jgi:hypothetical protein